MTTKKIDYIGSTQIHYRGEKSMARVSEIWGVPLSTTGEYADLQDRGEALRGLTSTPPPTLGELAMQGSPKTLGERVEKVAPAYAAWQMIAAQKDQARQHITDRMKREMDSPAMFDHLLDQLPLAAVEQQFVSAVDSLGQSVYQLASAVDRDAQATADLRESGRKLAALQYLMTRSDNSIYASALYVDISHEHEKLTYGKDGFGRVTEYYDQTALDQHQSLVLLRSGALDTGSGFTAVALGAKPGVKFSLAKSHAELVERSERMRNAGHRHQV